MSTDLQYFITGFDASLSCSGSQLHCGDKNSDFVAANDSHTDAAATLHKSDTSEVAPVKRQPGEVATPPKVFSLC